MIGRPKALRLRVYSIREGQKNDYNDAEAIAEAALRPNLF
jgi:hypothetical protein